MGRRRKGLPINGWVIVDKPSDITSTAVVGVVRRLFNAQKAGHAGTLDPIATGILPVALGEATKTVPYIVAAEKSYRFTMRLGEARDTDDREGEVTAMSDKRPSDAEFAAALGAFHGAIEQRPPRYSAIKLQGERAYDLARAGEEVDDLIKPRQVHIYATRFLERPDADHAVIEVDCSKGTYVRAIARDLGVQLGCYGHVEALRRIRLGPFLESRAIALDKLSDLGHSADAAETLSAHLHPIETALDDIPALALSGADATRLKQGQAVLVRGRDAPILEGSVLATHKGHPVALTEYVRGELKPVRVFNLS